MPILHTYIVPHPPVIVPAVGNGQENGIRRTVESYERVAERIASDEPDTILLISPHSVMYADYIHISPGESAKGSFARFGVPQVALSAVYDSQLTAAIAEEAANAKLPAGMLGERDKALDHGTLVPLYFINQKYTKYRLVRISVSDLSPEDHYRFGMCLKAAVERLGRRAIVVASGDLSHRLKDDGPYGFTPEGPRFDREISEAMKQADFLRFMTFPDNLCEAAGECGLRGFIMMAGALDGLAVSPEFLSYEGPFGVGYAVCIFSPGQADEKRRFLKVFQEKTAAEAESRKASEDAFVSLARQSLESYVQTGKRVKRPEDLPKALTDKKAGVFVSLKKRGNLRGCIGTVFPTQSSVAEEILHNAVSAGTEDPRFSPVTKTELPLIVYSVDVLGKPEPIKSPDQLDVKRYGVIVRSGNRSGLLLPNLEGVDTVERQLEIALKKAGISEGKPYTMERFEVVRHQ